MGASPFGNGGADAPHDAHHLGGQQARKDKGSRRSATGMLRGTQRPIPAALAAAAGTSLELRRGRSHILPGRKGQHGRHVSPGARKHQPHGPLLKQPADTQELIKIMRVRAFLRSVKERYDRDGGRRRLEIIEQTLGF